MVVGHHELPVVQVQLVLKSGAAADPVDRAGIASMTAAMLDEGTKTRNALEISNHLGAIGARLLTGADLDSSSVSLTTLTKHLDRALDIFSDVLINPEFPDSELSLQRKQRLTALLQRRDNAEAIAGVVYSSLLCFYTANHIRTDTPWSVMKNRLAPCPLTISVSFTRHIIGQITQL